MFLKTGVRGRRLDSPWIRVEVGSLDKYTQEYIAL